MECLINVFELLGIEIIGDVFLDLFLIKVNLRIIYSNLEIGMLCSVCEVLYCLFEEFGFDNNVNVLLVFLNSVFDNCLILFRSFKCLLICF